MGDMMQLVPHIGQTIGLLVALWYFLEFQKSRDRTQADSLVGLVVRIESGLSATRVDVLSAVREQDIRHQQTTMTLFALTRETVQTVGTLSGSIASLSQSVQEQRQAILELRMMIHADHKGIKEKIEGEKKP